MAGKIVAVVFSDQAQVQQCITSGMQTLCQQHRMGALKVSHFLQTMHRL
jgi:hypothetical protein